MITIENISKFFNNHNETFDALQSINLQINDGQCVIFKGSSGSGKSTLLSIIGAMSKPTSGAIFINQTNLCKLPDDKLSEIRAQNIGFVFQSFNLLDELSVEQNIEATLVFSNYTKAQKQELIQNAMKLANINSKSKTIAKNLSGGEKQRCAIARALVKNPPIIIADEPTANLDKANSLALLDVFANLKKLGKTIIIATHDDIFESTNITDQIYHIEYGKIVN